MSRNIKFEDIHNVSNDEDSSLSPRQPERQRIEQFILVEQQHIEEIHPASDESSEEKERPCLERLTSEEQRRMREIFDALDEDHDEVISKRELKKYIKDHPLGKLPTNLVKNIMDMSDSNLDGVLDYKEFCEMDTKYRWLFTNYILRYVEIVTSKPKSYEHKMSIYPPPLTMISFSLIEIVIFLIDVIYNFSRKINNPNDDITTGLSANVLIYNPYRRYEIWRFLTYMFVHGSVLHIALNLIVQIFLGFALELRHRWWRVALVYMAGVLAGSIGNSIIEPDYCLRGASGGVYAIICAHIASTIINWGEMEYRIVKVVVFSVFLIIDIGYSTYLRHNEIDVPGYASHLFGALAGLLVGIGALKNYEKRRWELRLSWCAVSFYSFLMIAGVFIHIFLANKFKIPSWNSAVQCQL